MTCRIHLLTRALLEAPYEKGSWGSTFVGNQSQMTSLGKLSWLQAVRHFSSRKLMYICLEITESAHSATSAMAIRSF
jgi:hypothetical protein